MKVGDKLLCREDYSPHFTSNKFYNIVKIDINENFIQINSDINKKCGFFLSLKHIHKPDNWHRSWYVWNRFYTEHQLRKLKLEKLNEEGWR